MQGKVVWFRTVARMGLRSEAGRWVGMSLWEVLNVSLEDLGIFSGGDESAGLGKLVLWCFILRRLQVEALKEGFVRRDDDGLNSVVSVNRRAKGKVQADFQPETD